MRQMILPANPVNEREPILIPQANIQQDRVRQWKIRNRHKAFFQVIRNDCFVAFGFKPRLEKFAKLRIVIDNENPVLHMSSFS